MKPLKKTSKKTAEFDKKYDAWMRSPPTHFTELKAKAALELQEPENEWDRIFNVSPDAKSTYEIDVLSPVSDLSSEETTVLSRISSRLASRYGKPPELQVTAKIGNLTFDSHPLLPEEKEKVRLGLEKKIREKEGGASLSLGPLRLKRPNSPSPSSSFEQKSPEI